MKLLKKVATAGAAAMLLSFASASLADCPNCGVVRSVHEVKVKGQSSGGGAVVGGVVGGLLGNQIGHGSGRTLATVAGVAGGAYAGNEIEKNAKSHMVWRVEVDMDSGDHRRFTYNNDPGFMSGDKVRVVDGKLRRIGNN